MSNKINLKKKPHIKKIGSDWVVSYDPFTMVTSSSYFQMCSDAQDFISTLNLKGSENDQ